MINDTQRQQIIDDLTKATVKIFVFNTIFKGTGFFISEDGYLLTAYHCLGKEVADIVIESPTMGKFRAILDEAHSLRHEQHDIAVLKIHDHITHYVPLGLINRDHRYSEIVTVGYPHGHFICVHGRISELYDSKFSNEAMTDPGHSGGLVYHYETRRVVGLAMTASESSKIGYAARFDKLFEYWSELKEINRNAKVIDPFNHVKEEMLTANAIAKPESLPPKSQVITIGNRASGNIVIAGDNNRIK